MEIESTERVWFKLLGTPQESEDDSTRPRVFLVMAWAWGKWWRPQFFSTRCFFGWTIEPSPISINFWCTCWWCNVPRLHHWDILASLWRDWANICCALRSSTFERLVAVKSHRSIPCGLAMPCLVGTVMVVIRLLTRCQFYAEHIWDTRLAQTNLIISIILIYLNQVYPQLDGNDRLPVPGFHRLKSILNVLKPVLFFLFVWQSFSREH